MGLAVVVCIFSLVGFESATTLGAEAKNASKNVPRAVIASLLITGAFMVFMALRRGVRHQQLRRRRGPPPRSTSWPRPTG